MSQADPAEIFPAEQSPKRRSSVLLVLGITGGVLGLACCGGAVALMMYMYGLYRNSISEDPNQIVARTAEIVDIQIPQEFKPTVSVEMPIPFKKNNVFTAAIYRSESPDGFVALMEFGEGLAMDRDSMRQSLRDFLSEVHRHEDINVTASEDRRFMVRGQEAWFEVARGTGIDSGVSFVRVTGTFPGKHGEVLFLFYIESEKYDEEQLTRMIESIR